LIELSETYLKEILALSKEVAADFKLLKDESKQVLIDLFKKSQGK
jgi:hypothetical protein